MAKLTTLPENQRVTIAAAATVLPFPPTTWGTVPEWWTQAGPGGVVGEVQLDIWAAADVDLSDAELLVATPQPQVIADVVLTGVNAGANTLAKTGHGLLVGDGPLFLTNVGGALPSPLEVDVGYYAIPTDANNFQVARTLRDALSGVAVDLTNGGSGTTTVADSAATQRLRWMSYGLLGHAGDGAVELKATRGYSKRVPSSARAAAFAVSATLSASVAVSAAAWPLV